LRAIADSSPEIAPADESFDDLLRAWECVAYLRHQIEIRFVPADSVTAPESQHEQHIFVDRIFRRNYTRYPEPDPSFEITEGVEQLMGAIADFRGRKRTLPSSVNDMLKVLHASARPERPPKTPDVRYNISPEVWSALEELAGRGAQLAESWTVQRAYRGPEWQWMQEALRLVTLQVGRGRVGLPATQLSLADFTSRL
jgi:hypothetical protein